MNNCHTKQGKVIQTCNAEITRKSNKGFIRIFKRRKKMFQYMYNVILIYLTELFNLNCFIDNFMKSVDITERIHFKFCKLLLNSKLLGILCAWYIANDNSNKKNGQNWLMGKAQNVQNYYRTHWRIHRGAEGTFAPPPLKNKKN